MLEMFTVRTLVCVVFGGACGIAAKFWIAQLLFQRGLPDSLTKKTETILILAAAAAGGAVGTYTTGWLMPVWGMLLICICSVVFVIDWNHRIIPNQAVLAVFALRILIEIAAVLNGSASIYRILSALAGMIACFVIFTLPGLFGGKVGAGDVKLAAAMGFLLGTTDSLIGIVIMGLLIIGYWIIRRQMPLLEFLRTNIPMGPFITVGMFAAFLQSAAVF